jgi:hypothetical protein
MCSDHTHKPILSLFFLAAAACWLLSAGCAWQHPQSMGSFDDWNLTPAQRDSLSAILVANRDVKKENSRLRDQIRTQQLDMTKMSTELEYRVARNRYLEEALTNAQNDLALVEKQFVSLERQLQSNDTKASAVAVLAEVKLNFDNLLKDDSASPDSTTIQEIEQKIQESEQLLQKQNFAASTYYARRADRLVQLARHVTPQNQTTGQAKIVSVNRANLRQGPSIDHTIITNLDFGTVLIQIDQSGDWSKIRTRDGQEGWILTTLLR